MKFSINQVLLLFAVVFGVGLLLLPDFSKNIPTDPEDVVTTILAGRDRITPQELQKWLQKEGQELLILDIRSEEAYQQGHIPSAKNIPFAEFGKKDTIQGLPSNVPIVVYSEREILSAQIWILLKGAGKKAYYLLGGFHVWKKLQKGEKIHLSIPRAAPSSPSKPPKKHQPKKDHGDDEGC